MKLIESSPNKIKPSLSCVKDFILNYINQARPSPDHQS